MATGRTTNRYTRVYVDGYDLSGYARTIGPLDVTYDAHQDVVMISDYISYMLGQATVSPGTLNGLWDNTATTGIHDLMKDPSVIRNLIVAMGIQAAPSIGNPCFMGQFRQNSYTTTPGDNPVGASIAFSPTAANSTSLVYSQPWGVILHANDGAETTDNATEYHDGLAPSSDGGYMFYQVLSSAGAGGIHATIKVQDSATTVDGDFADLLTSGEIDTGAAGVAVPTKGVVALAAGSAVKRYTRWQIGWGVGGDACTSITFVLGFCRLKIPVA